MRYIFALLMLLGFASHAKEELILQSLQQDNDFRSQVVGIDQVSVEKKLIAAKNGVFVLFTPSFGTPQMISPSGNIPQGLIPSDRIANYEVSIKPRVETTYQMPLNNVHCIYIHYQHHRANSENPNQNVEETYYFQRLRENPKKIITKMISRDEYDKYHMQGIPAAFYYYIPEESITPQFFAIFGKQVNATEGYKATDPTVYYSRVQDLEVVNTMLLTIGFKSIDHILKSSDIRTCHQTK